MTDLITATRWWGILFVTGLAVWPIVSKLFKGWSNNAYLLSKIFGLICVGYLIWIGGSIKLVPFGFASAWTMLILVGGFAWYKWGKKEGLNWKSVVKDEAVFLMAFAAWTWVKGHEPEINGLEKFMDYGFTKSILNSQFFPPRDMWFAGSIINYYYFGHLLLAVLVKLSGVDLSLGFNLMLSTLFAMTFSMSYAIGRELLSVEKKLVKTGGAIFIAVLVSLAGNLQTIYAFTSGYQSDNPPPFWQIWSNPFSLENFKRGFESYWYPNATRFIPYTIHEFPGYSFVVSDIHGHVLAIPIVLLLISLLVHLWQSNEKSRQIIEITVYAFICGIAFMTNALDGPIYLGLLFIVWAVKTRQRPKWGKSLLQMILISSGTVLLTIAPFLASFRPFVSGVGVNCPPSFLAGKKIGPLIFEEVEKCQKSPIWMMLLLWGFFVYWGLVMYKKIPQSDKHKGLYISIGLFCLGLIIFPEFFYFKDIYPLHFRSNTMFKLGYQAFIMMSIISGWTIVYLAVNRKRVKHAGRYLLAGLPLLFLVLIYPYFSVKSYFNSLKEYRGIYGLNWMRVEYPENWGVVNWLNSISSNREKLTILEAQGDSYQDPITHKPYNQISAFTGLPTVAGWYVHEWLWRGQMQIAQRSEEVREIYETDDSNLASRLLNKYRVKYIVVGEMEREKYQQLNELKFAAIAKLVFVTGETRVYQII